MRKAIERRRARSSGFRLAVATVIGASGQRAIVRMHIPPCRTFVLYGFYSIALNFNRITRLSCKDNQVRICGIVLGLGGLDALRGARKRGDGHRRGLQCLLRLRVRRTCPGRRRRRAFLLFSGTDLWRDGRFLHGGVLWSPDGLDREGFTLKVMRFGRAVPLPLRRAQQCLGDRHRGGSPAVARLALQARTGSKSSYSSGSTSRTTSPVPTIRPTGCMARRSASASPSICGRTDANDHGRRRCLADLDRHRLFGARRLWLARVDDWFYLGPEAQTFACIGFSQLRFGVHLTGLKTGSYANGRRRPAGPAIATIDPAPICVSAF